MVIRRNLHTALVFFGLACSFGIVAAVDDCSKTDSCPVSSFSALQSKMGRKKGGEFGPLGHQENQKCIYGMKCHRRSIGSLYEKISHQQTNMPNIDTNALPQKVQKLLHGLNVSERKVHSQNGEDGVLEHIMSVLEPTGKQYVEFGVENGMQCNTRYLREQYNWTGLLMDGGYENNYINLRKEMIYVENIISLFQKYKVPFPEFDLLSVDIDMTDFWVTREILQNGYRPLVIINEVNAGSRFQPPVGKSVPPDATPGSWDGTDYFGASVSAFAALYRKYDYSIVYCENMGVNCFGVRNDILNFKLSDILLDKDVYRTAKYGFNSGYKDGGHPHDPHHRTFVDVKPYL